MTDKRHHDRKHPKVTTTHQNCGSLCTCGCRTQRSDCIREKPDGGRENVFVRGECVRRGSGKAPSSGEDAVVRQLQNDPHRIFGRMRDERCFTGVCQHRFNGGPFPTSPNLSRRRDIISARVNNNSISRDVLLLHIARNLLLAKLAPFLGTFTDAQSELYSKKKNEKMDMLVSHKKHRLRTGEDDSQKRERHHHRHHRNGHKSDGELERERMRAKLRGGDKEKATGSEMERSSSDRGRVKESTRRVETDEEREERRRRRRERKEAEARLETDPILSDSKKGHRSSRRDSERKASSRKESRRESDRVEGNLSPRSDKDKQVVLARREKEKEKESSRVSTREIIRPGVSSSSRRAEGRQRTREAEKSNEHSVKSSEKEKSKESSEGLGFVLEKKQRMVECVSCLSDDVPRNQAAHLTACGHYFCNECLKRIFKLSLTDPALMPPKCCNTDHIPLKHVEPLLSYSTKKQWNKKYNEYTSSNRIYCPTKDCGHWIAPKYITEKIGQCSRCKTKVCTKCNGKAHGSSECPEDEDLKAFIKTVKENGYQKCYRCKAVVELKSGCNHITCRCTAEFCYRCGEKWKTCDCPWFAYPDSEEEEEEEEDAVIPVRVINEPPEAPRERERERLRVQREEREERERRERDREVQIAEDESLARRLAQASLFLDKSSLEKLDRNGSLRTGLRNSYKKLAEEYAEASKRDEEAKEERIRDRLQKLRDRDEAIRSARRGSTSSNRETRSSTTRHERRHSEPKPLTSRGSHSRPQTAQSLQTPPSPLAQENREEDIAQRQIFEDERAARIAKYIMGELDELDDETPVQPFNPVENTTVSSSPQYRSHSEKTRRATTSGISTRPSSSRRAEHGTDARPVHHMPQYHTNKPVAANVLPRLETPRYAASSVLADVSFPLENEKPHRRSSSNARGGKIRENYIHSNTKSAPTSPMHSTPASVLDSSSARRNYLADLGYKFLKHQQHVAAPHSAYPLSYGTPVPAPAYTYSYSSYSGLGPGTRESSRARQFTQNWGGIEAMGPTWKEPFADRLELSSRVPPPVGVPIPRTTY